MRFLLMMFLSAVVVFGQDTSAWITIQSLPPSPTNAHDYAIQQIKSWAAYMEQRNAKLEASAPKGWSIAAQPVKFASVFKFSGTEQSVEIDKEGNVTLTAISTEDALLTVVASNLGRTMFDMMEWDRRDRERAEAMESIPPSKIKAKGRVYHVQNIPHWSSDASLMGDTNCNAGRVRILEDGHHKQDTVLHEMMHVATACSFDPALHKAIYDISPGLLELLRNNPDLVTYLTRKPVAK